MHATTCTDSHEISRVHSFCNRSQLMQAATLPFRSAMFHLVLELVYSCGQCAVGFEGECLHWSFWFIDDGTIYIYIYRANNRAPLVALAYSQGIVRECTDIYTRFGDRFVLYYTCVWPVQLRNNCQAICCDLSVHINLHRFLYLAIE